jgi:hypothetical protein
MDNYFLKKVFSIKAVVFGDEVNGSYWIEHIMI